jgi:RNA polymerase sigma-70 factor (ECF subfamily)
VVNAYQPPRDDAVDVPTHNVPDDAALIDRLARGGDARAFELLYRRYTPAGYSTALRLTGNPDLAQDIVHDAWVRAVESLDRFSRRSSFRTWLTGIVINCHRERSREHRREAIESDTALDDFVDSSGSGPLDGSTIEPLDLEAAIAALAPRFREVFVLHDIEGFTHEEIAAMLGLVPGTSKSQLTRARRRVRELLDSGIPRTAR